MTTPTRMTVATSVPSLKTNSTSSSSSSAADIDFPQIDAIRPPPPPVRGKGVSDRQWKAITAQFRSDKADFQRNVSRARIAAKARADKPKVESKTQAPKIAAAPNRSDLIRQGLLDPAMAPVHSSRKARARQTAEAFRSWASIAQSSKKAGVLVKKLSPMALATNPARERLTGDAAKAVALAKRKFRAERKRTNDANRAKKTIAKAEGRQAHLDVEEALRPPRTHTRFPPPGSPAPRAKPWALDEDVPSDDQVSWAARHHFTIKRDPTHGLHCNLSGFHFWAEGRDAVTQRSLNLDPSKWSMERGVFTYHGRLPGGLPVNRKCPKHTSSSQTVSEQMVSYVNFSNLPASAQALITDGHVAWLLLCPDTVLLAIYGPHDSNVEEVLRTRMMASLRGSRASNPVMATLPPSFTDHTAHEVALWCNKQPPTPMVHTTLARDAEHPIRISLVCGSSITEMWARTLEDAVAIHHNVRDSGCTVTMTVEEMDHVIIIIVPRLSGGRPALVHDIPDESVIIKVATPYETRLMTFSTVAQASDFLKRLLVENLVVVSIDEDGILTYTLRGRLVGGGKSKDRKIREPKTHKDAKEAARSRSEPNPGASVSSDFDKALIAKKRHTNQKQQAQRAMASSSSSSSSSSADAPPTRFRSRCDWGDAQEDLDAAYEQEADDLLEGEIAMTPTEVLRGACDSLQTSAAQAKASLTAAIKKGLIAMKAHRRTEPDWDDDHTRWVTTFAHLGRVFYFDGRVLEEDRVQLMNHTETLPPDAGLAIFSAHFRSEPDQFLMDQIAFGWGARNFRELSGPNVQITSTVRTPRVPPARSYAYAFAACAPMTTQEELDLVGRILRGMATSADMAQVRTWMDCHKDMDVSDRLRLETTARGRVRAACAAGELTNPLIPQPPEEPEAEAVAAVTCADRYASAVEVESMPLPRSKVYREDVGVRVHVIMRQYIDAYCEHLAEGQEKVGSVIEAFVPERHVFIRSVLKLVGVASILAIPALTAFRATTTKRATFSHVLPFMGLRLYNRRRCATIRSDLVTGLDACDPTKSRVTLSEDMPWSQSMLNKEPADAYFVNGRDACVVDRFVGVPANPLARLARMLTEQSRAQIPVGPEAGNSYTSDGRTEIASHDKLLVRECTIAPMRVTSTCLEGSSYRDLLVCRELFSQMTRNALRYKSIMTGSNGFVNLSAALLTGTLQASVHFNIPITTRDRADIEHDTAFAASLAIWARCCQADGASVDPYEDY